MRRLRTGRWLAVCCAALLAACSAHRIAYDHFDSLLRWWISEYVSLTTAQKQALEAELVPLWNWHRSTQLPLYAADLRQLAEQVQAGPLNEQQIADASALLDQHWETLQDQVLPAYARLSAQLDDAQVDELVRHVAEHIDKRAAKRRKQTPAERDQKLVDEMDKMLRDWIGKPDGQQRELVRQWAAQTPPAPDAPTQHALLDRYTALLAGRRQEGFEQRLRDFLKTENARADGDPAEVTRERLWRQLLVELSASLTAEQRGAFRQHLLEYAEDCEALAGEKAEAVPE
jgi:hypothetical protein